MHSNIYTSNKKFHPDFYNWNRVLVVYCDGSSFIGHVEDVDPKLNSPVHCSKPTYITGVPECLNIADNVVLIGTSAGGLATILHCDGFRQLVPFARRVKCVADSGFFLHAKNLPGAEEREDYYAKVVQLHGLQNYLPTLCLWRQTNPGLTIAEAIGDWYFDRASFQEIDTTNVVPRDCASPLDSDAFYKKCFELTAPHHL